MTAHRLPLGLLVLPLLAAGCSVGVGQKKVAKKTLNSTISSELAAKYHRPAPKVDCPEDLKAKVGQSERCVLTDATSGTKLPVTVRIRTVADKKATYSIAVGTKPIK